MSSIRSDTLINLVVYYQNILELASNLELSKAPHKVISYAKKIFKKKISFLKKSFAHETDNTMEQIFYLIGDFVDKFSYNLGVYFNKRCSRIGKWAGFSPLMKVKFQCG